jgi:hypothetical protein
MWIKQLSLWPEKGVGMNGKHLAEHWEMARADTGVVAPANAATNPSPAPAVSRKTTGQMNAQQSDTYASFHDREMKSGRRRRPTLLWTRATRYFIQ